MGKEVKIEKSAEMTVDKMENISKQHTESNSVEILKENRAEKCDMKTKNTKDAKENKRKGNELISNKLFASNKINNKRKAPKEKCDSDDSISLEFSGNTP